MKDVDAVAYLRYKVILFLIIARQRRDFAVTTCVSASLCALTTLLPP